MIHGTWLAKITPDPGGNASQYGHPEPINGAIIIEQTFWSVSVTLLAPESTSHSTAAAIIRTGQLATVGSLSTRI